MDVEYHVAGNITDGGIRVGVGIVEEPDSCIIGAFGGVGLVGRDGSEGDQHGWIHGNGIVEEHANNLLDKVGCQGCKQGQVIVVLCKLDLGSVGRLGPGMRSILAAGGFGMLETVKGSGYIAASENRI
jgi:hypothetical protein